MINSLRLAAGKGIKKAKKAELCLVALTNGAIVGLVRNANRRQKMTESINNLTITANYEWSNKHMQCGVQNTVVVVTNSAGKVVYRTMTDKPNGYCRESAINAARAFAANA